MELANCFSIPILPPFVRFAISQPGSGMMERCSRDDGTAAARLTEHSCPAATESGMTMLQGVQQLSVHLGLRRSSHLTGHWDIFIPAGPGVSGCYQRRFVLDRHCGCSGRSKSVVRHAEKRLRTGGDWFHMFIEGNLHSRLLKPEYFLVSWVSRTENCCWGEKKTF